MECLKYENYWEASFLGIQKQFSCLLLPEAIKSSLQVTFDADTLKVKATSPISVVKNKKEYFQLILNRTHTLVACTRFFMYFCSIGRVSKIAHSKIGLENPDLGTYAPHLSKYESGALLWKHTLILNQKRDNVANLY